MGRHPPEADPYKKRILLPNVKYRQLNCPPIGGVRLKSPVVALRIGAVIAIVVSIIGLALASKPSSVPQTRAISNNLPLTDLNPLGANFFLEKEVEDWKKEETLRMAQEAGIGWAKVHFTWEEIEPKKGYFWDDKYKKSTWQKYDQIVDLAEKYGLRVIARLDRPPVWSRKDNRYATAPPDNFQDYGDFVEAVVSRYKGRVQFYQIWNEPNIWPEWGDRAVDPAGYVEMLKIAHQRAKKADSNVVILSAPLATTMERTERNLSEVDYLEGMYKAGAKTYFDVLAANAYGFDRPPDDPPSLEALNFRRVELVREIMVRNGDEGKPVWLNEFGWNASPADFPPDSLFWRRVSEQDQAKYTTDAIKLTRSWGWVGVINIWYFRQVGDIPITRSDYFFRMVDLDFTPRPVYYQVKELSKEFKVSGVGAYQEMNGAVQSQGNWSVKLDPSAQGGVALSAMEEGQRVTFKFKGTQVSLVTQSGPNKGGFRVLIDGKDPNLESKDKDGSYVEVPPGPDGDSITLNLASGIGAGEHTLELITFKGPNSSNAGEWLIDAFVVDNSPTFTMFWIFGVLAALGVLGLGLSLVILRRRA